MTNANETLQIHCRFLQDDEFPALHATFLEGFSDYVFQFQISAEQLRTHITQNSVDLKRSVGAFAGDKLIGFTLNGFGEWNGKRTIYDAGTAVIPSFRQRGVGTMIFEHMLPIFRAEGFEQILLEVISHNEKAVKLYEKLGFETSRRLVYFENKEIFKFETAGGFEVRQLEEFDWKLFETFADSQTSWQNSAVSMSKSHRKVVLGLFYAERCVGYGIFFTSSGIISQLAVDPEFRGRRIASMLLGAMQKRLEEGKTLRASNVDETLPAAQFLQKCGFSEVFAQFEMTLTL